ncbi:MAG: hypothetical protein Q8O28_11815 [Smithellaceae bacterium]|nr:hypothetical protein [Smithellaceae bacterium]
MNRIIAAVNFCISGYFIVNIIKHMIRPGMNSEYTRMLMFACLATIPLVFMLMMVAGKERWLFLLESGKEMAGGGPLMVLLLVGLVILLILMPLGMLAGIWYGMGFQFGTMFILYFVPIISRLIFNTTQQSIVAAITQGLLFFAAFLIGISIVEILERFSSGAQLYDAHLQLVWPDYRDAAKMFFSVCVFALINQIIAVYYEVQSMLGRT